MLGLKPLSGSFYRHLDVSNLLLVYGFSPSLLPRPDDWGEWLKVSGHWFLETRSAWQPPTGLLRFMDAGSFPIYIGFGRMVDGQIQYSTPIILGALQRLGLRGILMGGWGGLGLGNLPETILCLDSIPHTWLFPRVATVVHHGGAGTTATGLLFGRPTIVIPFFADQPFWGGRVHALGCGPKPIPFTRLTITNLAEAMETALNPACRQNAQDLSEKLCLEDGVGMALGFIQNYLGA